MNKDDILIPVLTAINDLREEVRENRRAIQKNSEKIDRNSELIRKNSEKIDRNSELIRKNSEKIDRNSELIRKNSEKIDGNSKSIKSLEERIISIENRMERHEQESKKDRKAILDILCSYEQVTDRQYKENKERIEKMEAKNAIISA